ncbi:MAG TPA: aminopeptidase P family protein [Deltaproteobacteria bacterium]|nr:aminopeptidase P family protein [Deltaproteobacteria bacterium]
MSPAGSGGARRRLAALRRRLDGLGVDALIVADPDNIRYLTGFTGSSATLVVGRRRAVLLTDGRYRIQAARECRGIARRITRDAAAETAGIVEEWGASRVGFESAALSYGRYERLRAALRRAARLKPLADAVESLRLIKEASEIDALRAAAGLAALGFDEAERLIRPGATELEVAAGVEAAVRRRGAEGMAFETIVASGERCALPHARPTMKKIRKGELVLVDMGVRLEGYNSDNTRVYAVGRATRLQRDVYALVREAQERAVEAAAPGVAAEAVDAAARAVIRKAGYGRRFGHGTGHGVGLKVHEGPSIAPGSGAVLAQGMVFTVEPGVYIEGWGGVRIEDMVVLTGRGCEKITDAPGGLRVL